MRQMPLLLVTAPFAAAAFTRLETRARGGFSKFAALLVLLAAAFHAAFLLLTALRARMCQPASIRSFLALFAAMVLLQTACFSSAAQQVQGRISAAPSPSAANRASIAANYGKLPPGFEANQGQVDPQVRFLSRGNGYSLFLTDREAVLSLRRLEQGGISSSTGLLGGKSSAKARSFYRGDVVRMQLDGASSGMRFLWG